MGWHSSQAAGTTLVDLAVEDKEYQAVEHEMQSTIMEHKDSGQAGGVFSRYRVIKVGGASVCRGGGVKWRGAVLHNAMWVGTEADGLCTRYAARCSCLSWSGGCLMVVVGSALRWSSVTLHASA